MDDTRTDRRGFLVTAAGACAAGAVLGLVPSSLYASGDKPPAVPPGFPQQDADSVREVVGASHARIDRVRELVTARPALAKAAWDWGFGDWETALGAASHTGRFDIARLLMDHGARPDVFTLAMMGELDAVRAMIAASPGLQRTPGPHGITLLRHARTGAEREGLTAKEAARAKDLVAYLEVLGDAGAPEPKMISEELKKSCMGRYNHGPGDEAALFVELNKQGDLVIRPGSKSGIRLTLVEDSTFHPAGAPAVRIVFEMSAAKAVGITIHDPMPILKAVRAG